MGADRSSRLVAVSLVLAAGLWLRLPASGQQAERNQAELQQLKSEVRRIEQRIDALEAAQAALQKPSTSEKMGAATPVTDLPTAEKAQPLNSTGPEAVREAEAKGTDTMDAGMGGDQINLPYIPQLKIRGFGDVRGYLANQNLAVIGNEPGAPMLATQGGYSTFSLGLMDLFVTSKISDRFSYLAEIGFEGEAPSNGIAVDLERAQLSYTPNDKFSLSAGRTHAMMGYYNTAFHHGTWFQTTIDRPRIFEFEDSGGPLPIHNVGISAMGKVPSKKLGLHWLAEVGNGKQTYSLQATVTPANVLADHTGKSTNLGLYIRPDKFSGLQAGFNWYQASLVPVVTLLPGYGTPAFPFPSAASYYKQNIFVAHVVYIQPHFEFMVEDAEIRDLPRGSNRPLYTSGGYAQISKAYGVVRPYFRYQWLNPNFNDPNNAWVGRWVGPNAGVRWDINTFIALKAEYSHFDWKNFSIDPSANQVLPVLHKTIEELGTQLTYTF
jgi:hypothetical protein